jgi:hypothetical protein
MAKERWEQELAKLLLSRHLQVSFPSRDGGVEPRLKKGSRFGRTAPLRTVAVIGAGASSPVLELGAKLADRLERDHGVSHGADHNAELLRLERVFGFKRDQFETRLVALCRSPEDQRKVRDQLAEWYGIRHPSLFVYEVIAHLLKHRFLDAVITFNFDELLDQSLDDEIGKNEYVRVISERDCLDLETDPDDPDYLPLYVKMHGTASEPETLRFTRESYFWTPRPIVRAVERLFDNEHLVVINIGCRLAGFDIHDLLRKPQHLTMFHADPTPLDDTVVEEIEKCREERGGFDDPILCGKVAKVEDYSLRRVFTRLMRELEEVADSSAARPADWRSIGRHRAMTDLLGHERLRNRRHYAEYLRRRTILEVGFATAKERGVLSMSALANERCGRYYDLYAQIASPRPGPLPWAAICKAGGLVEARDAPDAYYVTMECRKSGTAKPAKRAKPGSERALPVIAPAALAAHVLAGIDPIRFPRDGRAGREHARLATVLKHLRDGDEVEFHSRGDRISSKVFVAPRVLPTRTAFRAWSGTLTDDPKAFDELRIVAETAGWLEGRKELRKTKLKLILAFDRSAKDLRKEFRHAEIRYLPWWRHNRHMRLAFWEQRPVGGVFYARRLRTSMVTPVYLYDAEDLRRAELNFDLLWDEAKAYEKRLPKRYRR